MGWSLSTPRRCVPGNYCIIHWHVLHNTASDETSLNLTAFVVLISGILQNSFRCCDTRPYVGVAMLFNPNAEVSVFMSLRSNFVMKTKWLHPCIYENMYVWTNSGTQVATPCISLFRLGKFFWSSDWLLLLPKMKHQRTRFEIVLIRPWRTLSVTNVYSNIS